MSFRIDAVYQRTVAELVARGPLWMIFTPLAVDADPERMRQVLDKLRAETAPREFGELSAALTVVAAKDKRHRDLRGAILSLLEEEDVMESSVYKLGEQRGEQKKLMRLYEKRLGHALSADERATLVTRLGTLGADRLDELIFALSAEALAAWLRDPNAT